MTSLKTSIKTITYLSDIGCLEIQGASLVPTRQTRNKCLCFRHEPSHSHQGWQYFCGCNY
ncbi:hypothetical protein CH644_23450 [Salmonella enterica subsp. enterica serovar Kentucky]|nr:hypothetical protein CH644_23450 [Salmonella enterica subsp. enterica serovar Kentucky]